MSEKITAWKLLWCDSKRRRYVFLCIAVTLSVTVVQPILVGSIYSGAKAVELLQSLQTSSLSFGAAIAKSSATILALMLTLLGMTDKLDTNFDRAFYGSIKLIGLLSTLTFIGSVLLLLGLSLPVGEFKNIPGWWYMLLYYAISALNGLLAGLIIIGVLVVFDTIIVLIKKLAPSNRQ